MRRPRNNGKPVIDLIEYNMRRCWGRTKTLRKCGRIGDWRCFCPDHIWQPITVVLLILLPFSAYVSGIFSSIAGQYGQTNKALQELVNSIIQTQHHKLMKKYPDGYVLFIVSNSKGIVVPEDSSFYNRDRFELNWSTARVTQLNRDEIVLRLPNILDKENNVELVDVDSASKRKVGILDKPFMVLGFIITTELLINKSEGVICLIGFRKANP